jgi:hypothetical protein
MTNSLIKNTTYETVLGFEEVPGTPYVPAQPARTVYEVRNVCGFRYSGAGHYVFTTDSSGHSSMIWVADVAPAPGSYSVSTGTWLCTNETVPVTYRGTPAIAATPGHTIEVEQNVRAYNLGWNAGGRSIAFITANGYATFQARASLVGAIVGLNVDDGVDGRYSGVTIDYGFLLMRGSARLIENGVVGAYLGAYTDATVFKIDRTGTTITYSMAGTTVHTSTGAATTATWLEAALYSGDDEVFNPAITQVSSPDLTTLHATIDITLPALELLMADVPYASIDLELPALTVDSTNGLALPSYAVIDIQLPPLALDVDSLTGEIATISLTLPSLTVLAADHPYAAINLVLPALDAAVWAVDGNENASMDSRAGAASTLAAVTVMLVLMSSTGQVTTALSAQVVMPAEMRSEAFFGSTFSTSALMDAVMRSVATAGTLATVPESDIQTWVVSLASSGSTSYANYPFNSFAKIGDAYFGAGPGGIYELDGDTDDGAPIRAALSLGKRDFGSSAKKTVSECYLGMSSSGNLFVKVIAEDEEFIYKTEDNSPEMQQQRLKFGKGLQANYLTLELYNEDGADFELDTVEFMVADLSRKT